MTARVSSGSSRSPIAVDPTRSTNITLRSRRSGGGAAAATGPVALGFVAREAPQSPQNRLSAGLLPPQALHCHGRGVPQSPQNFLLFATVAPQRAHIISSPKT